jgi:hypothetical protein
LALRQRRSQIDRADGLLREEQLKEEEKFEMKKFKLSMIIIATLVAVLLPTQFAFAAKTADVTINITAQKIAIELYDQGVGTGPTAWSIVGLTQDDYSKSKAPTTPTVAQPTAPTDNATCTWDVKNAGSGNILVKIAGKNLTTDATAWTLAAATGVNQYQLWWATSSGGWQALTADGVQSTLIGHLTASTKQPFGLSLKAPTDFDASSVTAQTVVTLTGMREA